MNWEEFQFIKPTFIGDSKEDLKISVHALNVYHREDTIEVELNLESSVQNINDDPIGKPEIIGTMRRTKH